MTRNEVHQVVGYVRLSPRPDKGAAGLDAQRAAIEAACRQRKWKLVGVYVDESAHGWGLKHQPQLVMALLALTKGDADGLVVAKLDRLCRSMYTFADLVERARQSNWALVALDFDLDTSTPAGELMANVLMAFAQWERRRIGERTADALAIKREQGVRLGRPVSVSEAATARIVELRRHGATFQAIAEQLAAEGFAAPRGERWLKATVARIAARQPGMPPSRVGRRPRIAAG